jgi:hypothetical protein
VRTFSPTPIAYGYSPACCHKRLLTTDRFGEADVGPPPDPGPVVIGDPYIDLVVLLLGYDGGSALDESWSKPKGDGGGTVSTFAKFGAYSGFPSGGGVPNFNGGSPDENDDFNLAPDQMTEFTIEAWMYLPVTPVDVQVICGKSFFSVGWVFCTNGPEMRFSYQVEESGFGGHGNFTNVLTTGANLVGGRWYYVAVDKDSAKNFRLYVDGVMLGKLTPNDASIGNFWLESVSVGNIGLFGTNTWTGYIDELRITKHLARYKTDGSYPVPTDKWPRPKPP